MAAGDRRKGRSLKPIDYYRSLALAKGRREHGRFLVEGVRCVSQVAQIAPGAVEELLSAGELPAGLAGRFPVRTISSSQLRSVASGENPTGPIAVVHMPGDASDDSPPANPGTRVLLCEHIQDPGNVGALIRTAAALGFDGAVLSDRSADPFAPKCVQAAAGSTLSLWIRRSARYVSLIGQLREQGLRILAADAHGDSRLDPAIAAGPLILALGNEGAGLSHELRRLADRSFTIPIDLRRAESLNVAACGAIAMFMLSQPR